MKTNNKRNPWFQNKLGAQVRRIRRAGLALTVCLLGGFLNAWAQDPYLYNLTYPKDTNVSVGATVSFRVYANTTNGPLTYQWQHAGTNLPACTNNPLVLTNVTLADAGGYVAWVTNASGDFTNSRTATLTVDSTFVKIMTGPGGGTDTAGSGGAAWGDYNGDGYPDLFIAKMILGTTSARNVFWQNNGDGSFTKITTGSPVLDYGAWWYPYWVDYDNDGGPRSARACIRYQDR